MLIIEYCSYLSAVFWCIFLLALFWLIYVPFDLNQDREEAVKVKKSTGARKSFKRRCNQSVAGPRVKYPPPFPNGWYAVTHSSDIKREQVKSFDFLGTRVAVFRNDKGQIHVLDAFCPHLGADIGIGGTVRGDCVECPFHHWTFKGSTGECVNISYSKSDQIPKNAKLNKWISKEVNGAIFAWYHAENDEPWEMPIDQRVESKEMVYHGGNVLWVNSHIQEIPENGADAAHLMAVHGDTVLSGGSCGPRNWLWNLCGGHGWEANWRQPTEESQKHVALSELKHYLRFFNKYRLFDVDIVAEQMGPGVVRLNLTSSIGKFFILQTVTPVAPLLQKVTHSVYARRELFLPAKVLVFMETVMIKRDIEMWNNKQYVDTPLLVKEDKFIKSYRLWFKQFYSPNSITYKEASESLDW